eukprot:CAMPEP_0117075548 /NCGR_PEP_ID=MMETSP0472-20121206/53266_1 /TAXON_ID=693140 ORGANISM="Tiarina fusus, Strain LIS" /NCGR_SAMPLE_ID=MMETSP0472 /ASSEMBLY_ACC=CAM_ASM_000603 /LENGTH=155 /DNA_ID=CAMNT_0004801103 /DNA_START=51 /DNA_END=515 /DNA_ORIENTATION=-
MSDLSKKITISLTGNKRVPIPQEERDSSLPPTKKQKKTTPTPTSPTQTSQSAHQALPDPTEVTKFFENLGAIDLSLYLKDFLQGDPLVPSSILEPGSSAEWVFYYFLVFAQATNPKRVALSDWTSALLQMQRINGKYLFEGWRVTGEKNLYQVLV